MIANLETGRFKMDDFRLNAGIPKGNFAMMMGDGQANILWEYQVEKTLINRIKYWFFFQFFPFKLKRWDK